MTRQRIRLVAAEHPALSFVASQRIEGALSDHPRYTAVTAAKLVSEIVHALVNNRSPEAIHLEVSTAPGRVNVTLSSLGTSPGGRLDGLARLLLDRLAAGWGEQPGANRLWFELTTGSTRPAANATAAR